MYITSQLLFTYDAMDVGCRMCHIRMPLVGHENGKHEVMGSFVWPVIALTRLLHCTRNQEEISLAFVSRRGTKQFMVPTGKDK